MKIKLKALDVIFTACIMNAFISFMYLFTDEVLHAIFFLLWVLIWTVWVLIWNVQEVIYKLDG